MCFLEVIVYTDNRFDRKTFRYLVEFLINIFKRMFLKTVSNALRYSIKDINKINVQQDSGFTGNQYFNLRTKLIFLQIYRTNRK